MEIALNTLFTAIISGVTVGAIVTIIKARMDQNSDKAKQVTELQAAQVKQEIKVVLDQVVVVDGKVDKLTTYVHKLDKKVSVFAVEMEHLKKAVAELEEKDDNGKVIRKP